jgi:hypothetical protein
MLIVIAKDILGGNCHFKNVVSKYLGNIAMHGIQT